jgi:hypothetical protein
MVKLRLGKDDIPSWRPIGTKPTGVAAIYAAALVLFGVAARVPLAGVVATFVSLAAMGIAGVVFLACLAPSLESPICLLVFGTTVGLACGRLLLVLFQLCFGHSFLTAALVLGILPVVALALLISSPRILPRWSADEVHEITWVFGLNAAVLVTMAMAFWGVGRLTSQGYAFVPYFFLDFLSHATCASALARQFPPENPYFAGESFHYYWFYHLWPAAIINLSGITARSAITLTQPVNAFLFVGSLVCLGRVYMPRLASRHLAIGIGLFAFSYIGILFVGRTASSWLMESISKYLNLGYSCLTHSWYRDFLYEPHAVTALTCLLFLVYLESTSLTRSSTRISLLAGVTLGIVTVTDLFVGMIALLWFAVLNARLFLQEKHLRFPIAVESLAVTAVILGAFLLQLFPARSSQLGLGFHAMTKYAPIYLLVELGPLFVFGALGLYLCLLRRRSTEFRPVLVLLVTALVIAFTVIVPVEVNQVIRKSIKVVQVPLVILTAVACDAYLRLPRRHWLRLAGAAVIVAGFTALCTDVFQYIDLVPAQSRGAQYITGDRMRALEWIRSHTPTDAIVQLLDEVRPGRTAAGNFDLSVPAISERRTLFGNYKYLSLTHIATDLVDQRKAILEHAFTAKKAGDLRNCLERLPACYLVVDGNAPGPLDAVRQLKDSRYLKEVFREGSTSVLWKGQSGHQFSLVQAPNP